MPRYVILIHDHPVLHWDLMLESNGVLRTWRLATPPEAGKAIAAEAIGDHRIAYLDYEGPVSGGRGEVRRWDHGEFVVHLGTDQVVRIGVTGEKLRGTLTLEKDNRTWSVTFERERET